MHLSKIKRGIERRPDLILIYAENGEGKTTLAASAPGALVLDLERGAGAVGADRVEPGTFAEVLETLGELATAEHEFRTVVLDTVDELERMTRDHVIAREGWTQADYDAYGRGLKVSAMELDRVWRAIEKIRARGIGVLILAHAALRKEREADAATEVDRWGLRCSPAVGNLFRERCDAVWFLRREKIVAPVKGAKDRKKIAGLGRHILYTRPSALAYGKDRLGMPPEIEIPLGGWSTVQAAMDEVTRPINDEEISAMIERLPEPNQEKARAWIASQKDKQAAARLLRERVHGQ